VVLSVQSSGASSLRHAKRFCISHRASLHRPLERSVVGLSLIPAPERGFQQRLEVPVGWRQFIYGIDEELILSEHDNCADYDETTIRAIVKGDFKLRQPKAFSSITY
jgi:hypothetical protein